MGFDRGFRKIAMNKEAVGESISNTYHSIKRGVGKVVSPIGSAISRSAGTGGPIGAGLTAANFVGDLTSIYNKAMGRS